MLRHSCGLGGERFVDGVATFRASLQFPLPIRLLFVHRPGNLADFCYTDEPGLAHDRIGIEVGKQGVIFTALRG
jgi:hypothetical protein